MKLAEELEKLGIDGCYCFVKQSLVGSHIVRCEYCLKLRNNLPAILAALRDGELARELERKCEGLQLMVDELKADRIDLLAQNRTLQQALAEPQAEKLNHEWACGCGWINGVNLPICAQCSRTPLEGHGRING